MYLNKTISPALLVVFFFCSTHLTIADEQLIHNRNGKINVMTQNLYVGADLLRVVNVSGPEQVPLAMAQMLAVIKQTNFIERADEIAKQIKKQNPELIGLQEVFLLRTQSPGDFYNGNPQNAQHVLFDYLKILLTALERQGLNYYVASTVDNLDVELPAVSDLNDINNSQLIDVRLNDRDVILARRNIKTSNPTSVNFQVSLVLPIAGTNVPVTRGYTAVDAKVSGVTYRVANTHLEIKGSGLISTIQAMQAEELITWLNNQTQPLVLMADLNSSPVDPIDNTTGLVPPYKQIIWAGYKDAWLANDTDKPGFTCCQAEDLSNPVSQMNERIDYIFYRSEITAPADQKNIRIKTLGDKIQDKTPSGLWPSDHAGVAAVMKFEGHEKYSTIQQ